LAHDLSELDASIADNPRQREALIKLRAVANERQDLLRETIERHRAGDSASILCSRDAARP